MKRFLAQLEAELTVLDRTAQRRRLITAQGIDFASNDYLALARDPLLLKAVRARLAQTDAVGTPASRLLRGHTDQHAQLETRLARFKGTERALLFPSGYQANIGLISALVRSTDRVLSDAANHASLIDGIRLAGCQKTVLPHGNLDALGSALADRFSGRTFVIVESLYSMDGDVTPIETVANLCDRHGALLIVDDAHATGLFGNRGSGLVEEHALVERCVAVVSTLGKALGVAGAFVAGSATVIETLVNRSRPFLFTTASPPVLLHAVDAALDLVASHPERRKQTLARADQLRKQLRASGVTVTGGPGPIVPVIVGDEPTALAVAAAVQQRGFDVRAIRPPTVPPGTCRLRLSVHADHDEPTIDALARAVTEALASITQPALAS